MTFTRHTLKTVRLWNFQIQLLASGWMGGNHCWWPSSNFP